MRGKWDWVGTQGFGSATERGEEGATMEDTQISLGQWELLNEGAGNQLQRFRYWKGRGKGQGHHGASGNYYIRSVTKVSTILE
jgi:hypothetical protein